MGSIATIKGVDTEAWRIFKAEAARHGVSMGEFFGTLVRKHTAEEVMTQAEAFRTMDIIRAKVGKWQGSKEVLQWRKKHTF